MRPAEPLRYRVQVTSGRGPLPARKFVAALAQRLQELGEGSGLTIVDVTLYGDEEAPGSVEILVLGDAASLLGEEQGTHALVARSAERGKAARKRWFASVSVRLAERERDVDPDAIDPRDLEVTATRASGPGGQHVNKTSTAVRVLHRPSGLTVRVADERSQRANLRRAVERIAERLAAADARVKAEDAAARRRAHDRVERGAPVRTYRIGHRGELELTDAFGIASPNRRAFAPFSGA